MNRLDEYKEKLDQLKAQGVEVIPLELLKDGVAGMLEEIGPMFFTILRDTPEAKNYFAFTFRMDADKETDNDFAVVLLKRGGKVPDSFWFGK